MAGTGKSTISRTVAHELYQRGSLGASFLFKRGRGDRGSAVRFFPTIAAQLIHQLPPLAPHVRSAIEADSNVGESLIEEQFKKLILQPMNEIEGDQRNPLRIVIVVDALDECESEGHAKEIIGLLLQAKQLQSIRIKFFVTSRPETHLRLEFKEISGTFKDRALHHEDKDTVDHDISGYFESELSEARDGYNKLAPDDCQLSSDWPGKANLQELVEMASRLFIFAATVCRFLKDQNHGSSPDKDLKDILRRYKTGSQMFNLDDMYSFVLGQVLAPVPDRAKDDKARDLCDILGPIVVLASPLSRAGLAHLLGIDDQEVYRSLNPLHSVLDIPSDKGAPINLLHLSFRDFLVDPKKPKTNPFWVNEKETHANLATQCLKLLSKGLRKDICKLRMPGKPRADIDEQKILAHLLLEIQYACLYWVYHLKGSKRRIQDGDEIHRFLERYLLHWLEALSLIGSASESIGMIDELQSMTSVSCPAILTLTYTHKDPIASNSRRNLKLSTGC
jgi:hypothetical protein